MTRTHTKILRLYVLTARLLPINLCLDRKQIAGKREWERERFNITNHHIVPFCCPFCDRLTLIAITIAFLSQCLTSIVAAAIDHIIDRKASEIERIWCVPTHHPTRIQKEKEREIQIFCCCWWYLIIISRLILTIRERERERDWHLHNTTVCVCLWIIISLSMCWCEWSWCIGHIIVRIDRSIRIEIRVSSKLPNAS